MRGVIAALTAAWLVVAPAQASSLDPMVYARQLVKSADPGGQPFAVVDKLTARILVFHTDGTLAGASPALLGRTPGDRLVDGVGHRTQTGQLQPDDQTTPAGRFRSEPGRNQHGEDIVWIDYNAALAIHRLRPGSAMPDRARRLATASGRDNRVTAGCVVVTSRFFTEVVRPVMGQRPGVVYILPEEGPESAL